MNSWETVLCAFLITFVAITLGGLYKAGAFRRRKSKEPPLDKGLIPWIGHGITFGRTPIQFLEKMTKKHGDVFTVLAGGNYLHFVMDPHTYKFITKQSRNLNFTVMASNIAFNVFDIQSTEDLHKSIEVSSKKYLQGKSLVTLNQVMMENLMDVLIRQQDSGEEGRCWQKEGLFHFSFKTIFQAAFLTLFGSEPDEDDRGKENARENEKLFEEFQRFDQLFPQMALNILDRQSKKEAQSLRKYFWDLFSAKNLFQKNNVSSWVMELEHLMAEMEMSEEMRARIQLLILWASQANTAPATFWILAYLLKYPEAMKAVRGEVESVLRETGQEVNPGNHCISLSLDVMETPILDSAVDETLRLKSGSSMLRTVMKDTNLKMDDGREYLLREGDQLLVFPFLGLHMDPEIYPDPDMFRYDRFLSQDGVKKEFFKNGKKLKHHIMPFGGGQTMCPGRFFAVNEMKMFAIVMLTYFDMELVDPEVDLPPSNEMRSVIGVAQPMNDIKFKYRLRF